MENALIEIADACLLVIDVQEKLVPLVLNSHTLVKNCNWLLSLAGELDVVTFITEQYPRGLGHTVEDLQPFINSDIVKEKVCFSVVTDEACKNHLASINKKQVIVAGMETSVCVLQTVLELIKQNYSVFVVADAVSGRIQLDHDLALQRMQLAGAKLVTKEMVFFEWLRTAGNEKFKALSKQFLQ